MVNPVTKLPSIQFEDEYDVYKMRQLVDDLQRWVASVNQALGAITGVDVTITNSSETIEALPLSNFDIILIDEDGNVVSDEAGNIVVQG